jgi:hypothetical protein
LTIVSTKLFDIEAAESSNQISMPSRCSSAGSNQLREDWEKRPRRCPLRIITTVSGFLMRVCGGDVELAPFCAASRPRMYLLLISK